jgi:hypothetical protein
MTIYFFKKMAKLTAETGGEIMSDWGNARQANMVFYTRGRIGGSGEGS